MTERAVRPVAGASAVFLLLLALLAAAAATAAAQDDEANPAWKPVTLLYMTDVKGKIEPCG